VIETTIQLKFGLVILSGEKCPWMRRMKQNVLLKLPDGSAIKTLAFAMTGISPKGIVPLCIEELAKDQVPIGTEVWVERQADT
jgi:hypothetical protein